MTIAITGATGQLGRIVVEQLKATFAAADIIGLVRSSEKAADLGVTIREADYDKPETLGTALSGIDTLVLISANVIGKRLVQHQNVINAAKQAGVKRIIYTSLLHAESSSFSIADEHVATEKLLKDSGIPFTILRNGWYTENYANSIASGVATGRFMGSAGDGRIAAVPRKDYAEAIAAVAISGGHENKVYELAGDNAFTLSDLAKEVAAQTGKEITYTDLPAKEFAGELVKAGLPEGVAQLLSGMDVATSENDLFDDSHQLSQLIGRSTTPLKEAVAEILKKAPASHQ